MFVKLDSAPKMDSRPVPSHRTLRLAWWGAFAVTVALLAAVAFVRSARGAELPQPSARAALPPLFEEGEECEADEPDCTEEGEDEECEVDENGDEECFEAGDDGGDEAPPECLLTRAQPRISVSAAQRRLRLVVRYTVADPADVSVSLRSSGGKGAVTLPASKHHLGHSGSFHESIELSEAETERALAAKQFTVRLHVLDVPWTCHRYDFRHLTVKHGGHESPTYSESGADLRAGR